MLRSAGRGVRAPRAGMLIGVNGTRCRRRARFRPILMTTMLGTGTGSEIREPLGYAIVGGLALSQFLTLYTTPVVFLYLDRLTRRRPHELSADKHSSAPASVAVE